MIALLVLVQRFTPESPVCSLLREIQETAETPHDIEIIAKFSSPEEQRAFRSYLQQAGFSFRALGISIIRHTDYADQHADYNECYLQTLPSRQLIVPVPERSCGFLKGWDSHLRKQYEESARQSGHTIFTFHATPLSTDTDFTTALLGGGNVIAFSRDWLSIVGGFGIIAPLHAWTKAIHYHLRAAFQKSAAVILAKPLFNSIYPGEDISALLSEQFSIILSQEAKSIHLCIESQKREKEIADDMRNHDAISAMYALAERANIQQVYRHAFWRYAAETTPFILGMHSLPLMDVMCSAALHKRKQLNLWKAPLGWIPYLSRWNMEDMQPFPVLSSSTQAQSNSGLDRVTRWLKPGRK